MKKDLIRICSLTDKKLKKYLEKFLKDSGYTTKTDPMYLYAEGTMPVMLVAHLDTVHKVPARTFWTSLDGDILKASEGIGGDDRAGVYIIMELIKKGYRPYILFVDEEEVGCLGSAEFTRQYSQNHFDGKLKYILQFDRRGNKDVVRYDDGNDALTKYIETFGFKEDYGSYTDITELCPHFGISGVNLSSGYYNAHTLDEYIVYSEVRSVIGRAMDILDDISKAEYFTYVETYYNYKGYSRYGAYAKGYSDYLDDCSYGNYSGWNNDGLLMRKYKKTAAGYSTYIHFTESDLIYSTEELDMYIGPDGLNYYYGCCDFCVINKNKEYKGCQVHETTLGYFICDECIKQYKYNQCEECGLVEIMEDNSSGECSGCSTPYRKEKPKKKVTATTTNKKTTSGDKSKKKKK